MQMQQIVNETIWQQDKMQMQHNAKCKVQIRQNANTTNCKHHTMQKDKIETQQNVNETKCRHNKLQKRKTMTATILHATH